MVAQSIPAITSGTFEVVARLEERQPDHQRPQALALQEDDRDQTSFQTQSAWTIDDRDEHGTLERQDDRPPDAQVPGAVDPRGLHQRARHRAEELASRKVEKGSSRPM